MFISKTITAYPNKESGVTLIELIVFIVVTAIIMVSLTTVFRQAMVSLEQPAINNQMLDLARSQLEAVLSRRFDENTPSDGSPCDTLNPCAGVGLDSGESLLNTNSLDDVDDFNGYADTPIPGFTRTVGISLDGAALGIQQQYAKRIQVTVRTDGGSSLVLTAYKVNH